MNNKQFFTMLHSGVALVCWGAMLHWTRQLLPCLLGGLISIGVVVLVFNWAGKEEREE